MTTNLYLSPALVSCFDADGDAAAAAAAAAATAGGTPNTVTFTDEQQKHLNDLLAKERGKEQAKAQATLLKTEQTYKDMLANNQTLSVKERTTLEENLAAISGQLRTKDQQAALEKREIEERMTAKVKEHSDRAEQWESRYRGEHVQRSLLDAIGSDAFNPSQIVSLLLPMTKLVEEVDEKTGKATGKYKTIVEFPDEDATTGEPIITSRTATETIKRMKEKPEIYGNLFKTNVVAGIGANSSAGIPSGANGKIDLKKLAADPAKFRKVLAENPELLGLKKRGRR